MNIELMKNRRKELGMTQQDLADKCGLSKNTIYNYENGRVEATNENLEKISKVLNLDILDLILENKLTLPNDKDFGDVISFMQENLLNFIENIVSKNLKSKENNTRYISEKILYLINSLSGTTAILSEITERIIFFNIDTQKFSMCYFETFEGYILNLLSLSDNLLKNKLDLSALHLTNIFENEYKNSSFKLKDSELYKIEKEWYISINDDLKNFSNLLNNKILSKKAPTKKELSKIRREYIKIKNTSEINYNNFDSECLKMNEEKENLLKEIKNNYMLLCKKNELLNKEGGSNE